MEGKTSIPYPRDRIAAVQVLLSIARNGIVPENVARATRMSVGADKKEEEAPDWPMIPITGVNPDFTTITATAPDGTELYAEVKRESHEVVDAEVEECPQKSAADRRHSLASFPNPVPPRIV